jgi:flagellin-like hook-associated protein FlgL
MKISDNLMQVFTDSRTKIVNKMNQAYLTANENAQSTVPFKTSTYVNFSLKLQDYTLSGDLKVANNLNSLLQSTDTALSQQKDILNNIKGKLSAVTSNNLSNSEVDEIRTLIQTDITSLNTIASNTKYNDNYTLQKSKDDDSSSESLNISFSNNSENGINTDSFRSNSTGLGLSDLVNLSSGELNQTNAAEFITTVENAIDTVQNYIQELSNTTQVAHAEALNFLGTKETIEFDDKIVKEYNFEQESENFDKYKLIYDTGEYAAAQANLTQDKVLSLLKATDIEIQKEYKSDDKFKFDFSPTNKPDFAKSSSSYATASTNTSYSVAASGD